MKYVIDPNATIGERIKHMETTAGKTLDPSKKYKIASWGGTQPPEGGRPIWDVVAEYLRHHKTVRIKLPNTPKIINAEGNPGLDLS